MTIATYICMHTDTTPHEYITYAPSNRSELVMTN